MIGRSNLNRECIQTRLQSPRTTHLRIIIDADEDYIGAWKFIKTFCKDLISNLPERAPSEGFIGQFRERGILFGVWIMPNNQENGMFEDLLLAAFKPGKQPLKEHSKSFVVQGKELGAYYNPLHRSKAIINAWIALEEPGKPLWREPVFNTFDLRSSSLQPFVTWFRKLYEV